MKKILNHIWENGKEYLNHILSPDSSSPIAPEPPVYPRPNRPLEERPAAGAHDAPVVAVDLGQRPLADVAGRLGAPGLWSGWCWLGIESTY